MRVEQHLLDRAAPLNQTRLPDAQLVLVFGSATLLARLPFESWRALWPRAVFVGCGSSGEICNERVHEQHLQLTAVELERSRIAFARAKSDQEDEGEACGGNLARALPQDGLRHLFVLADALRCNPSALLRGLTATLPTEVSISGALAADDLTFTRGAILADAPPDEHCAVAIGFYGGALKIGQGLQSGWEGFGPDRRVTHARGRELLELDGESALNLYRRYLGDLVEQLPLSAQRYPLAVLGTSPWSPCPTRSILGFDDNAGSLALCGSVEEGTSLRMTKAVPDRLIRAAHNAANDCLLTGGHRPPFAIVASGIGRRLALGLRVEEEQEEIRRVLGPQLAQSGLYCYGQLAPLAPNMACDVHGQAISITSFDEV